MLATLLGEAGFRKGMDLYFERHDGEATTIEAFIKSFEDSNGVDLQHFTVTVQFDEKVNVTPTMSFAHHRQRVTATVGVYGVTAARTSDGEPHMRLRRE